MTAQSWLVLTLTHSSTDLGLAVALQAIMTTAEAAALDAKSLFAIEQELLTLANAIGSQYFPHGTNATRPEKLTGLA